MARIGSGAHLLTLPPLASRTSIRRRAASAFVNCYAQDSASSAAEPDLPNLRHKFSLFKVKTETAQVNIFSINVNVSI